MFGMYKDSLLSGFNLEISSWEGSYHYGESKGMPPPLEIEIVSVTIILLIIWINNECS